METFNSCWYWFNFKFPQNFLKNIASAMCIRAMWFLEITIKKNTVAGGLAGVVAHDIWNPFIKFYNMIWIVRGFWLVNKCVS